jgi:hypothetical protein
MRYDTIPKGLQVNSCRAQQGALPPCSIAIDSSSANLLINLDGDTLPGFIGKEL